MRAAMRFYQIIPPDHAYMGRHPAQRTLERWEQFCFGMMELEKRLG